MHPIDPGAIDVIQDVIVGQLQTGFQRVQAVAWPLLYAFAVIEMVLLGLGLALGRRAAAGELLWMVVKIGIVIFLIQNYAYLLQTVLAGFAWLGLQPQEVTDGAVTVQEVIQRPSRIWQLGYDPALGLLEVAVKADGGQPGIAFIYGWLGFGILVAFGVLVAQIVFTIVAFYGVALVALLMVPLGIFRPAGGLLDRALQQVLAAAARVLVLVLLVGVLVRLWPDLDVPRFTAKTPIDQPLGLFFLAATFALLAFRLPGLAARVVGPLAAARPRPADLAVEVAPARPIVAPAPLPAALRDGAQVAPGIAGRAAADRPAVTAAAGPAQLAPPAVSTPGAAGATGGGNATGTARVEGGRGESLPALGGSGGGPGSGRGARPGLRRHRRYAGRRLPQGAGQGGGPRRREPAQGAAAAGDARRGAPRARAGGQER
ncbi:MAG: type IV secretion system protein [Dongiaceae bacterium]